MKDLYIKKCVGVFFYTFSELDAAVTAAAQRMTAPLRIDIIND